MREEKSIILFDGVCNLCNGFVRFIRKRDKKKQFSFLALQSTKAKELCSVHNIPLDTDSVVLIQNEKYFLESDAAIQICKLLPTPWNWSVVFKVIPKTWRDRFYKWIAQNRYDWFGKRDSIKACNIEGEINNQLR